MQHIGEEINTLLVEASTSYCLVKAAAGQIDPHDCAIHLLLNRFRSLMGDGEDFWLGTCEYFSGSYNPIV